MEKDKYRERIKRSIDELFATIDDLDSKRGDVLEKAKLKYNEIMAQIKQLEASLEKKSRQAREGEEPGWEEAKKAFRNSALSFREAMENLISFIRKSSPPTGKNQGPDYEI